MSLMVCKELTPYNNIFFGPFIGEFGWEVFRWSGFVRWYANYFPEKRIRVMTRLSRRELYTNCKNIRIHDFTITDDYDGVSPDCYDCAGLTDEDYNFLINKMKTIHVAADYYIFEPRKFKCNRKVFDPKMADYNYTPEKGTQDIIANIIDNFKDRIPIVLVTRHRTDITMRNWKQEYWDDLMQSIHSSGRYVVFVAGEGNSYVPPNKDYADFLDMFKLSTIDGCTGSTLVGLTIEAIKRSRLTIGTQTGTIILSNLLKTPTMFWGHEVERHAVRENPYGTKSYGIEDRNYRADPNTIFKKLRELTP